MLDVFGIERSLLGKGCPYNNAVDEPANKMLKAELVYREAFGTTRELWVKLTDYVHWYNNFRMHSTLGYMTPVEFRKAGLVLPRIVQKDVANPYSSRGDWNMPWPGPIHKDSTHNAVRFGCYLGRHARMLHIFPLFPLDGVGSDAPSFQLRPVFGIDTECVPPNDAMSRFVGFGDKSWDNLKNFFQTQGFEFLFLSQSARRVAFGGSMAPKTPVLKLNRPFACKPPAAIASELTRVTCAPFAKPQVAGLRHS